MVTAVLFDTHAAIKQLKESGFEEKQAEALSGVLQSAQEAHLESLATKHDILLLQRDIKELELKIENRFEATTGEFKLMKWMLGFVFSGVLILILRSFFIP